MRKLVLVMAVLFAAACSDEDATGPAVDPLDDIVGTYTLETMNGQALPYPLIQVLDQFLMAQMGGSMTLNPNHTYVEKADLRTAFYDSVGAIVVEDTTVELRGKWEVEDSAILLIPDVDDNFLFGLVARSTLTLSVESSNDSLTTYFYRKNETGSGLASRPHISYRTSSSGSMSLSLSGSITRLLTTTSSTTGVRSTTTSSVSTTPRASALRASVIAGRSTGRASSGRSSP